jgi:hypothetical protein
MLFFADEHIRLIDARAILEPRGHTLRPVVIAEEDFTILEASEEEGAVILTADRWFYTQLRRTGRIRTAYQRASVIRIPGEWRVAAPLLRYWLPLIEVAYDQVQQTRDKRLVVEIRSSTILIDA